MALKENMLTVSENLKKLRIKKGLSQEKLHQDMKDKHYSIGLKTIKNYESATQQISVQKLCMFADYYGVTTEYILGITQEKTPQHKELKTNIKNVAQFLGLSEKAVTVIKCSDLSVGSNSIRSFLNYLLNYDDTTLECIRDIYLFQKSLPKDKFDKKKQAYINDICIKYNELSNKHKEKKDIQFYKAHFLKALIEFITHRPTQIYRQEPGKKIYNPILRIDTVSMERENIQITENLINELMLKGVNEFMKKLQEDFDKTENISKKEFQEAFNEGWNKYWEEKGQEPPHDKIIYEELL